MHAKRSSSNNLHHRENADRGHQGETQKRSWQPKLTAQSLRSNCVHNLGNTLGPNCTFNKWLWYDRPLAANEIADMATGVRAVYVYGRIQYRDALEKVRFTNFRLHYVGQFPPPQSAIFNFSEKGNDAN